MPRGEDNEQNRRADPSSHHNPAHRADPRAGTYYAVTDVSRASAAAEPALPSAGIGTGRGIRVGEIIGHRLWWVLRRNNELWLRSLAHDRFWAPGEVIYGNTRELVHCWGRREIWGGVYSYATSAGVSKELRYWSKLRLFSSLVCGTVRMWGDVVEHEDGYRAEYAKVASLRAIVLGEADLGDLWRRYLV